MHRLKLLLGLLISFASLSWATANNCGTPAGNSPTFNNPSTPITLATAANALGTGLGCQTIDKIFSAFAVSSTETNPPSTNPGAIAPNNTGEVSILGTLFSGTVTQPELIRIAFSAPAWIELSPDNGGSPDRIVTTVIDFKVTIDAASFPSGATYAIRGGMNYSSIDAGESIVVTNNICFASGPCTTADATLSFNNGTLASGTPSSFLSLSGQTTLFIRSIIVFTDDSADGVTLNSLFLDFQETPEPATFVLVGVGLAGLGLAAKRWKAL